MKKLRLTLLFVLVALLIIVGILFLVVKQGAPDQSINSTALTTSATPSPTDTATLYRIDVTAKQQEVLRTDGKKSEVVLISPARLRYINYRENFAVDFVADEFHEMPDGTVTDSEKGKGEFFPFIAYENVPGYEVVFDYAYVPADKGSAAIKHLSLADVTQRVKEQEYMAIETVDKTTLPENMHTVFNARFGESCPAISTKQEVSLEENGLRLSPVLPEDEDGSYAEGCNSHIRYEALYSQKYKKSLYILTPMGSCYIYMSSGDDYYEQQSCALIHDVKFLD